MTGAQNGKQSIVSIAKQVDEKFKKYLLEFDPEDAIQVARILFPNELYIASFIEHLNRLVSRFTAIKAKAAHSLSIGRYSGSPMVSIDIFKGVISENSIAALGDEIELLAEKSGQAGISSDESPTALEIRIVWE